MDHSNENDLLSLQTVLSEAFLSSSQLNRAHPLWKKLEIECHLLQNTQFESSLNLFHHLEQCFSTRFLNNQNHLPENLLGTKPSSELIATLILSLIWGTHKKHTSSVLVCEKLYYFLTPDGTLLRVNSNTARLLESQEKYELFKHPKLQSFNLIEFVEHYYEELCEDFIKKENFEKLIQAQNYMIKLDPSKTKWFARRALAYKRIGHYSLALADLKRFFSFCDFNEAPEYLKTSLIELEGLKALDHFKGPELH